MLTFEFLIHMLSLLMAAELNETLQHSNGVVSKRHLEAREQSETTVHKISEHENMKSKYKMDLHFFWRSFTSEQHYDNVGYFV